jgi:hypothetical protein
MWKKIEEKNWRRSKAWWYTPVIPAFRKLSPGGSQVQVQPVYIVRRCLKI